MDSKAVAIIVLVAVALYLGYALTIGNAPPTQDDAKKFFLEDLASKYPNADIREVVEITPAADGTPGAYTLKARITQGLKTACPERIHLYYAYPAKSFVAQPPDVITKDCVFCENEPKCIIAYEEEAIAASHTYPGTDDVNAYITAYPDFVPHADYAGKYGEWLNVWIVTWDSQKAPEMMRVILSKTQNTVLEVKKIEK
jgi:hypothetical protein